MKIWLHFKTNYIIHCYTLMGHIVFPATVYPHSKWHWSIFCYAWLPSHPRVSSVCFQANETERALCCCFTPLFCHSYLCTEQPWGARGWLSVSTWANVCVWVCVCQCGKWGEICAKRLADCPGSYVRLWLSGHQWCSSRTPTQTEAHQTSQFHLLRPCSETKTSCIIDGLVL